MNMKEITSCPDCGSTNIIHGTIREQIICRECGLIFEPLAPGIEEKMPLIKPAVRKAAAKAEPRKKAVKKAKAPKKKAQKKASKKKAVKKAKKSKKKISGLRRFLKGLGKKRK